MSTPTNPLPENAPPVLVIPAQAHKQHGADDPDKPDSAHQLVLGLLFGVVIGFLLQKGGLLFGVVFGLLGYCPWTGVAALGQGNYDAIAGILGLMAGSYIYAETSGYLGSTIQKIGNRGRIMLPDLLGMRLAVFLAVFVPLLVLGLFVMAQLAP